MAEDLNLKTIDTVDTRPFKKLVMSIGELPTSFVESMTYYELLAWFTNYLETVIIPTVNNNAEAVEELQQKYIEFKAETEEEIADFETRLTDAFNTLKNFVDNYFENLDVQEEINNKLDQMAEDGTLQEIIYQFLQSNVAWTFDTVADMKQATNLINGSYARTLGFRTLNDGGGAIYKITDTATANEMDVIAVSGDLYAQLIYTTTINPEMFGAYGDGVHDDATVLQYAFNLHRPIKLTKTYLTNSTINLYDWDYINIEGDSSYINYTGNNVAFFIYHIYGGNIRFGRINASNGGCIKLASSDGVNDRVIYLNVYFTRLDALNKCIEIEDENNGYVSEIKFYGGQLNNGDYGVYVDNKVTVSGSGSNGLYFYNMGFEGTDVNYYFNAPNQTLAGVSIINDRFVENNTNTAFQLVGRIARLYVQTWSNLKESRLNTTGVTNINNVRFDCPIMTSDNNQIFAQGIFYDRTGDKLYIHNDFSSQNPTLSTDVSSGTIQIQQLDGLVRIQMNGVTSSKYSYDIVTTTNPINAAYIPSANTIGTCSTEDGETARFWVRTDGSIAFAGNSAGAGKAFYGDLVYFPRVSNT